MELKVEELLGFDNDGLEDDAEEEWDLTDNGEFRTTSKLLPTHIRSTF